MGERHTAVTILDWWYGLRVLVARDGLGCCFRAEDKLGGDGWVEVEVFVEADIARRSASIEDAEWYFYSVLIDACDLADGRHTL